MKETDSFGAKSYLASEGLVDSSVLGMAEELRLMECWETISSGEFEAFLSVLLSAW